MYHTAIAVFCYLKDTFEIYILCVQGRTYRSPSEGLMTKSELQHLARQQLQTELNSYVQVKTIEKRNEPSDIILYYVSGIRQFFYSWLSSAKCQGKPPLRTEILLLADWVYCTLHKCAEHWNVSN